MLDEAPGVGWLYVSQAGAVAEPILRGLVPLQTPRGTCRAQGRQALTERVGGTSCRRPMFPSESGSLSRVRLCDPTDYTVPGILQARMLEWAAFPFARESSQPGD